MGVLEKNTQGRSGILEHDAIDGGATQNWYQLQPPAIIATQQTPKIWKRERAWHTSLLNIFNNHQNIAQWVNLVGVGS